MLSKWIGKQNVQKLLFIAYAALAFGLPFNKIVLSLATLLSALIVLLDFDAKNYFQKLKENKAIHFFLAFILFHFLSLIWTNNYSYFWTDFNSKLPFYALPIVLVLQPITSKKEFQYLIAIFLFSLLFTSIYNFVTFQTNPISEDVRYMSRFLSHIRYGMMLVFGMLCCYFWLINKNLKWKWIPILLISWFVIYTYFSEVFSAYLSFLLLLFIIIFKQIQASKNVLFKRISLSFTLVIFSSFLFIVIYFFFIEIKPIPIPSKDERTKFGNLYSYEPTKTTLINETPVYTYICTYELKIEWDKHSKKGFHDTNPSGFENYYILIQYLASKGFLKKDAESFSKLTKKDIQNIENGINNCCPEKNTGFIKRLKTLREEIFEPDPNGKTIRQRFEYLKAGNHLFAKNIFFGTSPGDLEDEFQAYYKKSNSHLKMENRLRTHNQFFTYFISFGIIGASFFTYFLYYVFLHFKKNKLLLANLLLLLVCFSFLSEDTLETQMGATFFGFFIGLFLGFKSNLLSDEH